MSLSVKHRAKQKIMVFLGPTLAKERAEKLCKADYRGPAVHGDIHDAVADGATTIILIDGYFGTTQSVWHKEIIHAMESGVAVLGAASMGALRAVELAPFGMQGVGKIFNQYADSSIDGDDEVAVTHAPPELGYQPLTLAMVDVRATIESGLVQRQIPEDAAAALLERAKGLHFSVRTARLLFAERPPKCEEAQWAPLADWFKASFFSQKTFDCEAALKQAESGLARPHVSPRPVNQTVFWKRRFPPAESFNRLSKEDASAVAELRLRPADYLARQGTVRGEAACTHETNQPLAGPAPTQDLFARELLYRGERKRHWLRTNHGNNMLVQMLPRPASKIVAEWLWKHRAELFDFNCDFRSPASVAKRLGFSTVDEFCSAVVIDVAYCHCTQEKPHMLQNIVNRADYRWKVWLYMSSANDSDGLGIDFEGQAQNCIDQIKSAAPFDRTTFYVQYDTQEKNTDSESEVSKPARLVIGKESEDQSEFLNAKDFSDPLVLVNFLLAASRNSRRIINEKPPRNVLILWGHGLGMEFLPDAGGKPGSGKQNVTNIVKFADALKDAGTQLQFAEDDRFEILGLDCCFMAHLETLARFADIANFIVAAPSAVPLISWPYRSITEIFEARFQPAQAAAVAASLATAGRDYFVENQELECPVLAIESGKVSEAVKKQHEFGAALAGLLASETHAEEWKLLISVARATARCHYLAPDYCELESFAERLLAEISVSLEEPNSWVVEVNSEKLQDLRDKADKAIEASRNTLVFPAPVRGGNSPRSVLVWFPVQRALYDLSAVLYSELVKSLQKANILDPNIEAVPGWMAFLRKLHGDETGIASLRKVDSSGSWIMGFPNIDKGDAANAL
jgi:hypothetical protein